MEFFYKWKVSDAAPLISGFFFGVDALTTRRMARGFHWCLSQATKDLLIDGYGSGASDTKANTRSRCPDTLAL